MHARLKKETVFVGLSGGVDSSVAALRLLREEKRVIGVFIKVWQPDFISCNWEKERLDAMRVAAHLNIPYMTFDAEAAYKQHVANYMINEYRNGRTPNPDVMCNEYVKFGAFFNFALSSGADKIATGHYARIENSNGEQHLYRGCDTNKDQSYFLWRLTEHELSRTYFPVGDSPKYIIRKEAAQVRIPTAEKHDSQGICFLGTIDMEDFLSHYISRKMGNVIDTQGNIIGTHTGALFYTFGQRHGFTIHTTTDHSRPFYVVAKNIEQNTITVDIKPPILNEKITLSHVNQIGGCDRSEIDVQFRYRQKPYRATIETVSTEHAILSIHDSDAEKPSAGQSCVWYEHNRCLGGGIIE